MDSLGISKCQFEEFFSGHVREFNKCHIYIYFELFSKLCNYQQGMELW